MGGLAENGKGVMFEGEGGERGTLHIHIHTGYYADFILDPLKSKLKDRLCSMVGLLWIVT